MRYAAQTTVATDKSRAEIERTLSRYGATHFMYGWDRSSAIIGFVIGGKQIQFKLPLPDRESDEFRLTNSRKWARSPQDQERAWEQSCRQRWRALALAIKAKLETVEAGISTFEAEFLAHIVLPNKQTVGDWLVPQITQAYRDGKMPGRLMLEHQE
jgi:hypothetical protein